MEIVIMIIKHKMVSQFKCKVIQNCRHKHQQKNYIEKVTLLLNKKKKYKIDLNSIMIKKINFNKI